MKKVLCMLIMTIAIGIMGGGTRTYVNCPLCQGHFELV